MCYWCFFRGAKPFSFGGVDCMFLADLYHMCNTLAVDMYAMTSLHELRSKCRPPGANICARVDQLRWRIIGDKLIPPLIMGILGFHGHIKPYEIRLMSLSRIIWKTMGHIVTRLTLPSPARKELIVINLFSANCFSHVSRTRFKPRTFLFVKGWLK